MANNVTVRNRQFTISYDGRSVVSINQTDDGNFDEGLAIIDGLLCDFHRSESGSTWGCDGIGYVIEKEHGKAFRKKSGVGKRKYAQGLESVLARIKSGGA